MHMTVRRGKPVRLGYDDQGGGFQGMPRNEDAGRTNVMRDQAEETGGTQRAAELQSGWAAEYAELYSLIQDNPRAVELLDRLVQTDPATHEALSGPGAAVARPVAEDTPPPFRGRPTTGARDATYRAMATDRRPGRLLTWERDEAAIRAIASQGAAAQRRRETEGFARRWPEIKRLRSV
jgi:hypothetical protein